MLTWNSDGWQKGFTNFPPRVPRRAAAIKALVISRFRAAFGRGGLEDSSSSYTNTDVAMLMGWKARSTAEVVTEAICQPSELLPFSPVSHVLCVRKNLACRAGEAGDGLRPPLLFLLFSMLKKSGFAHLRFPWPLFGEGHCA